MSGRMSGRSSRSVSFSAASAPLLSPGAMDDVTDILLASTKRYEDLPDAERKVQYHSLWLLSPSSNSYSLKSAKIDNFHELINPCTSHQFITNLFIVAARTYEAS